MAKASKGEGKGKGKDSGGDDAKNNNTVEKGHGEGEATGKKTQRGKCNATGPSLFAKPGKCSVCDEEFESQTQLKIHERKVHAGGTVVGCEECGAEFLCQSDYLRHKQLLNVRRGRPSSEL